MKRDIAIRNEHPRLRIPTAAVKRAVALLDDHFEKFLGGCPPGELSLAFLTDAGLAKIHGDFMDDPTTTDVITFEGDSLAGTAGEICVSADTAAKYVGLASGRTASSALQNKFGAELTLYVVHGWLHLSGYDDLRPAQKRRMRVAEKRAMALLAAAKAIPEFQLA